MIPTHKIGAHIFAQVASVAFSLLMITLLLMIGLTSLGCKQSQPNPAREQAAAMAPEIPDSSETELGALKRELNEYLRTTRNDPVTAEGEEFNKTLTQIATLDEKTVSAFVAEKGFTKAEEKSRQVAIELSKKAENDDDKKQVKGVLLGASIFTVVLSSLAVVGIGVSLAKDWKALTAAGKVSRLTRGGLSLGASVLAGIILSQGEATKNEVIALGAVMGIIAMIHAENALHNLLVSDQQLRADDIKFEIRQELVKSKVAGDLYKESEKIYAEAYNKTAVKRPESLVERTTAKIHDPKPASRAIWLNAFIAMTGAVLAGYATLGLAETPKARVINKINEFWQKMKALE